MSTLSAAEWNERYPSRLPVPVRYRNGHTDTVTTTRGAAWSDDDGEWVIVERFGPRPLAMIEPLATDEQRLAEGWLPPNKVEELDDLLYTAMAVIANASNVGDPPVDPVPGWNEAAARWRDSYHEWLRESRHEKRAPR